MDAKKIIKMFETSKVKGRHGDVVLVADETAIAAEKLPAVLAEGEATGHAHRVTSSMRSAQVFQVANERAQRLLKVTAKKAVVDHEEHTEQTLPRGNYRVGIQAQFTPTGLKKVID